MAISSQYIRNANIRAAFNSLLAQKPGYESELIKKRTLSYHDDKGLLHKNASVEPHFALTSDLQYWMMTDGIQFPSWWDVCDIVVGYWVYNLSTGVTYSAQSAEEITGYIMSLAPSISAKAIADTLGTWARHVKDIHALYGSYLFNPSTLVNLRGGDAAAQTVTDKIPGQNTTGNSAFGGKGLALAAGLAGLVIVTKMKKKRR